MSNAETKTTKTMNITEVLLPYVVIGTLATGVVMFTRTLTDYYLRKKMVDKGLMGDDAAELLKKQSSSEHGSLKWGLIILFSGIGLILLSAIPYGPDSPLPYGLFAVSVSVGFLIYFFISRRMDQNA